jgi:solute carrier family 35 (adenosine 3'-phospho 5'-phosphosulfate transporter), member B3
MNLLLRHMLDRTVSTTISQFSNIVHYTLIYTMRSKYPNSHPKEILCDEYESLSHSPPISTYPIHNSPMKRNRFLNGPDAAAGGKSRVPPRTAEDLFEDLEPVLVLGVDISHWSRRTQFMVCASGVFGFSLLYGYLQELISVHICQRKLGLFLAVAQFVGYTLWSYVLRTYVYEKQQKQIQALPFGTPTKTVLVVPFLMYLGLSLLRAVDLAMTNMAMQYVNYPAKTLMKSSRVVFTMLFGVLLARKKYRYWDYMVVLLMVLGLAIFMHADSNSSAVFHSLGIVMLTVSLLCDGAISNISETIMTSFGVGQDEFIFRMYSIALVAITVAAAVQGDLTEGTYFLMVPGTYAELHLPLNERTWTVIGKWSVMILFSTMGFFGSSCSAAITKHFGALTMSITSTSRKATTLFLSFALFENACTLEHVVGIFIFIGALIAKSLAKNHRPKGQRMTTALESSNESETMELLAPPFVTPNPNLNVV